MDKTRTHSISWPAVVLHFFVVALFISMPFLMNSLHKPGPPPGGQVIMRPDEHQIPFPLLNVYRPELQNLLLVVFFYINLLVLIPRFLIRSTIWRYVLVTSLAAFAMMIVVWAMHYGIDRMNHMRPVSFVARAPGLLVSFGIVTGIAVGLGLYNDWKRSQEEKAELRAVAVESELSFLKSQVSPHFLFNTLNNIYSMSVVQSPQTPDAVLKLASLMRYMLYEASAATVPLRKEIQNLNDYIDLQKIRLTDKVSIRFEVEGIVDDRAVHPLLLIPFIENAFKHGISYSNASQIEMRLHITADAVELFVSNPVVPADANQKDKSSGVGLLNVKKRLDLLYPDRHQLVIKNDGSTYRVTLKLETKPL